MNKVKKSLLRIFLTTCFPCLLLGNVSFAEDLMDVEQLEMQQRYVENEIPGTDSAQGMPYEEDPFASASEDDFLLAEEEGSEVPSIRLDHASMTLTIGEEKKLEATSLPEGTKVSWKSSDKGVATVNKKGNVTAKGIGECTITAAIKVEGNKYKAKCKVAVTEKESKSIDDFLGTYYSAEHLEEFRDYPCMVLYLSDNKALSRCDRNRYTTQGTVKIYDYDNYEISGDTITCSYSGAYNPYYGAYSDIGPGAHTFTLQSDDTLMEPGGEVMLWYPENGGAQGEDKTEEELREIASRNGTIGLWSYHDFDGNGTNEAFAVIVADTTIRSIYFVDSKGNTKAIVPYGSLDEYNMGPYNKENNSYYEREGKGFFYVNYNMGNATDWGHKAVLLSVKDGEPYELDLSRQISWFYDDQEAGLLYTISHRLEEYHIRMKVELLYDSESQQFYLGRDLGT